MKILRSKTSRKVMAVMLSVAMMMSNVNVYATETGDKVQTGTSVEASTEAETTQAGEDMTEFSQEGTETLESSEAKETETTTEETKTEVISTEATALSESTSEGETTTEETTSSEEELTAKQISGAATLNVSNEKNDTYKSDFIDKSGYFLVKATADKSITIENNTKGSFTKRMKMGGAGTVDARSVQFATTGKASVKLSIMSSSSSADRVVLVLDEQGNTVRELNLAATKDLVVLDTTLEEAGTYYIASKESGINIYGIDVKVYGADSSESEENKDEENKGDAADVTVQGDIYVAPNAKGTGSKEDPADFVKAVEALQAGHTIYMAEGTYEYDEMIVISEENSGSADAMKSIVADNAVLDFAGMGYTGSEADKSNRGIVLAGSYWNIKGLTITNAADNGMLLAGNHNVLDMCVFVANHDSGLQVSRFNTKYDSISQWPSYNLIKNCTSYNNSDITGENADGFAAKLTCGEGNVFDGCMSYNNSDDGWDLYAKTATGPIGVVTIKNCIAFRNGKLTDGAGSAGGDMNGFKLGGSGVGTPHVVINCIAFENGAHGFTDNNNPTGITLVNCTSFNNSVYESKKANFQMDRENGGVNANLLSFNTGKIGSDGFIGTIESSVYYNNKPAYYYVSEKSAINGKDKIGEVCTVTENDFTNLTAPAATTDFHKEWRNADGSINTGEFLQVSTSSKLATLATDGGKLGSRIADGVYMDKAPSVSEDKPSEEPSTEDPSTEETTEETTTEETTTEEETTEEETTTEEASSEEVVIDGEVVGHNFDENGLESDIFTFDGNMSDSKGTVNYDGMILTKCLKMESKTSIKFTANVDITLLMVFNEGETRKIKVDGEKYAINNGILTVVLPAGDHEITKGDSVNLYYIALVYPQAEEPQEPELPSLPEVEPVESVSGKIDVWDFAAEQLDTEKYTNKLTADIINSWFPGVEPGTTGKNLATFQVKDSDGNVLFGFNDGGYSTTHRLRSTNTAITRYDGKSLKNEAGEVVYNGYIYSNKGKTNTVYLEIALEAGDIVSFAVASNGTDSQLGFEAPSGKVDSSYTHTLGSSTASVATYYAAETGVYKLYSLTEKLVVARAYVQHTQPVNVVGRVEAPSSLTNDYSVVFTCKETGAKTEAKVENGTYKAVLNECYSYEVSLGNANGYVVTSANELSLENGVGGDDHYMQFDVKVDAVSLAKVSGELKGLSDIDVQKLSIKFNSDNIYIPEISLDGTGYTAVVEAGVEYVISVAGIDDYELGEVKTIKVSEDTTLDIIFNAKPLYKVTIVPQGASSEDLKDAEFVFTRHKDDDVTAEEKYVYRFTGTENIMLRDGVYTVKVNGLVDYEQKLTSNLKVDGADVSKTISFEFTGDPTLPKTWDFTGEEYTGQASYKGLEIVGGSKHSNQYGMSIGTGTITIPVPGNCTIKVGVGYTWDITDGKDSFLQTTNGGMQSVEFKYEGEAGTVVLTSASNGTRSYINSITMTPANAEPEVIPTSWDFRSDEYTGQSTYKGLEINSGKKHGADYGMMINNGSIKVPVTGPCTVKVSVGYNWDITIDGFQGERYKDKTNSGDIALEYSYTKGEGFVEVVAGSEFTSYIKSIETVYEASGNVENKTITVGATGCDYTTINDALAAVRKMNREPGQRVIIEIQPGDYEEMLVIDVKDVTLKNASKAPSIETKNKGVDIDDNAVRITSYYGHGYTYYSMGSDCKYSEEILAVNKENGYPSFVNPGSGTTNGSYWNATVVISADGFEADGIIFENSFNQYVSKKAANDVIVAQSSAKEGAVKRADMKAGDTTVQNKKYVERAAALALYNNVNKALFSNCKFIGRQDTLYGGTNTTAAFYDCAIYGGTDYIFGGMTAVFAKCDLVFNTMEDSNDVGYITAAQQKSGRGYLMYNCHVTSTVPGVDTASEKVSKPGYLGRPWQADTSEVVFYATIIDKSTDELSMIAPKGWLSTLSGTSDNVYEFGSYEMLDGIDNTSARESWAKTYADIKDAKLADGSAVTVETFLGDWDAFAGKDMTVKYPDGKEEPAPEPTPDPTPSETTEFVFESKDLTAFAAGAKADGEELKAGTEDYFTIICSTKTKVDSSSKTFEDGYESSQRLNLGGKALLEKNSVKFTTSNPASVKIWWAEGGDDNRQIAILNTAGEQVAVTADTVAKNAVCISTLELTEAGTYYLGGDINNNYIFKVVVTEEVPVVEEPFTMTLDTASDLTAFAAGAKADGEEIVAGTEDYFTIICSAKTKVDTSKKSFDDGYYSEQRLNLGGKALLEKNSVKFTTSNPASVKVWWAEGGDDNRQIAILNTAGEQVAVTSDTVAKNAACNSTLELTEAGTYFLGGDINNNYIFKIEVTETPTGASKPERADWSKVAAPVITEVALNAENANAVTVTVSANVGYDGADKVTVVMTDAQGNEIASRNSLAEKTEHTLSFEPASSGAYTFSAKIIRDGEEDKVAAETKTFDFVLPLTTPNIKGAYNVGNGNVEVEWDAVKEAQKYVVSVEGTDISVETTKLIATIKGLEIGKTYTIKVVAVRGEDTTEASIEKTVAKEAETKWYFAAYGSSTNTSSNGYQTLEDGSVRVYSTGGKGKIVPGSTDGLAFYYTKIDPKTTNFTLSATAKVNTWKLSNGQEGFGIMASDRVGKHGDGTMFWNNSYQAIASKVEYYYDPETGTATDDTTKQKVTMKLGLGSQEKIGVTAENLADFNANKTEVITENFKSACTTLELSGGQTGATNVVGNGTNVTGGMTEFRFTIQKNNTGYFVSYTDANGNTTTKKYYDTEALNQIEKDSVCLGFFASRNADITFTDIEFTTISPEEDAPAEERPVTLVTPNFKITSATVANSAAYDLTFVGNADGTLVITDAKGNEVINKTDVKANEKIAKTVEIEIGNNSFQVTFTPDEDYRPSEFEKLSSYETVSFTHTVLFKRYGEAGESIYVSPDGTSNGNGTKANPLDVYTAVKYVQAGQTIVIMEGTYNLTSTVKVERGINGTADNMIYMVADPEAKTRPVFDFGGRCAGMVLAGDYWYFKGFDVTRSADGQKGMQVSGKHNVVDQVNAYKNGNTGIQISRYLGTDTYAEWPAYNLILNCTSYLNADKGYEDADGFAAKLTVGDGNVFDGCIAAYNADDGWDLFAKVQSGSIGVVTIKNSVAYKNGYVIDENGNEVNAGNGNGFKMGGDSMSGHHVIKNSIAFFNKAKGLDSNSCPDIELYDCVSYDNENYNVALYTNTAANTAYVAEGVISYRKNVGLDVSETFKLLGTQDQAAVKNAKNFYWDVASKTSKNTEGVTVADDWFESLEFTGITRNADGTINMNGFLVLTDKALAGGSIGGTGSEDVEIGDETDGKIEGDVQESDPNPQPSEPSQSEASDSKVEVEVKAPSVIIIEENETPLAETFGGKIAVQVSNKEVLRVELLKKYAGQNVMLLQCVDKSFGVSIDMTQQGTADADLDLKYTMVSEPALSDVFNTIHAIPNNSVNLPNGTALHFNIGAEYVGKAAYIFVLSEDKKSYELKKIMTVNEIGNVAIESERFTDIIIMVQK